MKLNKRNLKSNKAITLIALVITIIVLLILATVSINLVINNGILDKAKSAVDNYSDGEVHEQIKLAYQEWQMTKLTGTTENAKDFIKKRLNSSIGNVEDVSVDDKAITVTINKNNEDKTYYYNIKNGTAKQIESAKSSSNKNDSYVGCYADIDEDGTVDGIIFVDLLTGSVRNEQQYGNSNGVYTLLTDVKTNNVNSYYISQKGYTDSNSNFGTHDVISPATTSGKQRFYVMQLENFETEAYNDINNSENNYEAYTNYYWYKGVYGHMRPLITTNNFGDGKENTKKMITKWNAAGTSEGYNDAPQDNRDIWKHIQTKYEEGWFIPSREEWAAFANEMGGENPITIDNYRKTYGLGDRYWSSSQASQGRSWIVYFGAGYMDDSNLNNTRYVRLATTF